MFPDLVSETKLFSNLNITSFNTSEIETLALKSFLCFPGFCHSAFFQTLQPPGSSILQ